MDKEELKNIYFSFYSQLTPEHAEKAKANYDEEYTSGVEAETHSESVGYGFCWSDTKEGHLYWEDIGCSLRTKTYPLQLTPQVLKDKAKEVLYGGLMPAHEWFKYLKPEHREAAMKLENDMGVEGELFESLADALWSKSWGEDSECPWGNIHEELEEGTYHQVERMATEEDYERLDKLTATPSWGGTVLPTGSELRKNVPVWSGFLAYFPRSIAKIAHHSWLSNEKHNPGEALHWSRDKSADHMDCLARHMLDQLDPNLDPLQEKIACAWRSLADLEIALEEASQ